MENERTLRVYSGFGSMSDEPRIQLMGQWLRNAGFQTGDLIRLKIKEGEIVIKNMQIEEVTK